MLLILLGVLFVSLFYLYIHIVIIPPNHKAVVERLGKFSRILDSGWYILGPFEGLKTVLWKYNEEVVQGNKSSIVNISNSTQFFRVDNTQLDLPPLQVISRDKLAVEINVTLTY